MSFDRLRGRITARTPRLRLFTIGVMTLLLAASPRGAGLDKDIRAVAVTLGGAEATDSSPARIVTAAFEAGFNTVFLPIQLEAGAATAPLIEAVVREAHARGMRVHAVVRPTRAADPSALPVTRAHVIYRHPEWLMVPRELAIELMTVDPRTPDYLGRLARWARGDGQESGGLHFSILQTDAAEYIAESVAQIVTRYSLDGVHLEGLRISAGAFDYSRSSLGVFRDAVRPGLTPAERARIDQVAAIDPFGYTEELAAEWARFRSTRLTALVARIGTAVRGVRPGAVVSAAVVRGADRALAIHVQDWQTWLDNGFVDALADEAAATPTLLTSYRTLLEAPGVVATAAGVAPAVAP